LPWSVHPTSALAWPWPMPCSGLCWTLLRLVMEGMSYGVPAFKVRGKTVAGFAAFKDHLSYLPHSGSVFPQLADELTGYTLSKGALRFDVDRALPAPLVERLVEIRLRQAFPD
jgi:uncharacterized protein YdhG (YjbR/CyaY superfamily)